MQLNGFQFFPSFISTVLKFIGNNSFPLTFYIKVDSSGFSGSTVVKNPPANAGDTGSSPGPGRSHMPQSN